jgi:phospholipase C
MTIMRLRTASRIAGITGPVSVKALAKKYGREPPINLRELLQAVSEMSALSEIKHLFVLVLENRSFDHIFGLSNLTGTDIVTGEMTAVEGIPSVIPTELDSKGTAYGIVPIASSPPFVLKGDIGHELRNVKRQLCGKACTADLAYADAPYSGNDNEIDNRGFVLDLELSIEGAKSLFEQQLGQQIDAKYFGAVNDAMHCFTPSALPVLTALAKEFLVCDNWFSSVPGPTFPNRMFIHAATSDGITYSPGGSELGVNVFTGFEFQNGHIFDRLDEKGLAWYVYVGDKLFNQTVVMDGIFPTDLSDRDDLAEDLADPDFDGAYVFIEPNYDPMNNYVDGNSMHPLNDPARAEALVKEVYETIRNSPCWEHSVLVITFDEHGGFFDHVRPPRGVAPGDAAEHEPEQSFDFTRLGVRVPAIIVSPLIPKNMIDHTQYDHNSILATLSDRFGTNTLTKRDAAATPFSHVFRLPSAREDAPTTLPTPASGVAEASEVITQPPQKPPDELPLGMLPESIKTFVLAAAVADRKERGAGSAAAVAAEVANLRTVGDVRRYSNEVRARVVLRQRIRRPPLRRHNP